MQKNQENKAKEVPLNVQEKNRPRVLNFGPIHQWVALNNVLRVYKIAGLSIAGLCALLVVALVMVSFKPPLVVVQNQNEIEQYRSVGKFKSVEINEETIEKVVRKFIHFRYEWNDLDSDRISKNLAPITTSGLNKKLKKIIEELKIKNFKGKAVSQTVTDIKVSVTKEKVIARFDKILKIEGLPLPVPTLIHLQILPDSITHWNPEGLYVNGVIERQVN